MHTYNFFRNICIPNQIWIVINFFPIDLHQTDFRFMLNLSEYSEIIEGYYL